MPFALHPTSIIPVLVTLDWTVADNAATDVKNALETAFPGVFKFPARAGIIFSLVQVQDLLGLEVTSEGTLSVAATTGTGTWSSGFGTYPEIGSTVYIIDMY